MAAYTKHTWVDRTGTGLNKFTDQNGNEYEFTPNPDSITQTGTPFSADWMNNIENGIKTLDNAYSSDKSIFTVKNASDEDSRAVVAAGSNGGYVYLYNPQGDIIGSMFCGETGCQMQLDNQSNTTELSLVAGNDGGGVVVNNTSGVSVASLYTLSNGGGGLTLDFANNQNALYLGESATDSFAYWNNSSGKRNAAVYTATNGGTMAVYDQNATPVAVLQSSSGNGGTAYFYDSNGTARISMASGNTSTNYSVFTLSDKTGAWRVRLETNLTNGTEDTVSLKTPPTTTAAANVAFGTWTGGGYYLMRVSSSRKLKENIETVGDPEETILKINPVKYTDKKTKKEHYGYIAEEMAEACPLLTEYDEKGDPCSIEYDRVNVLLLKAVQDLYKRVETLEAEIKMLREAK